jgi:hypothetical protein
MEFTLVDLSTAGAGKGITNPPDTDVLGYLMSVRGAALGKAVLPVASVSRPND